MRLATKNTLIEDFPSIDLDMLDRLSLEAEVRSTKPKPVKPQDKTPSVYRIKRRFW